MYLYNKNFVTFDPELIASELDFDIMEVMGYISVLADKGLITLDIDKNNGVIEEKISLNNFYEKINLSLMSSFNEEEVFYLTSRGIPEEESIYLLIKGFLYM